VTEVVNYTDPAEDVPSPIDLRDPADAKAWANACETATPGRTAMRATFVNSLAGLGLGSRVLELGSGPGFLAQAILEGCPQLASYTLFDFSEPMLQMSRERLGADTRADFVLGDFKHPDWARGLAGPYDAVVSMQAIHEIRHKRHVPALFRQIRELLAPRGLLLVADRGPKDGSLRWTSLHSTADEQLTAMDLAGFTDRHLVTAIEPLYLVRGRKG
jgi:SAM-dependent methyltransferase